MQRLNFFTCINVNINHQNQTGRINVTPKTMLGSNISRNEQHISNISIFLMIINVALYDMKYSLSKNRSFRATSLVATCNFKIKIKIIQMYCLL